MDTKFKFMVGVLGMEGARALQKAAQRSTDLDGVLLPRAILAWLDVADSHEGDLPGIPNTYLSFAKSQTGYSGSISIGDEVFPFAEVTKMYLASAIAVSLLGSHRLDVPPSLRDHDLTNLGKSIDLLAKAHALAVTLTKAEPPGPAAAPHAQEAPTAPMAPAKASRIPRPPVKKLGTVHVPAAPKRTVKIPGLRKPSIQITKSQQDRECPGCGVKQFKAGILRGCVCFRDLVKSVKVEDSGDNLTLSFGSQWDVDAIATFLEALGVK